MVLRAQQNRFAAGSASVVRFSNVVRSRVSGMSAVGTFAVQQPTRPTPDQLDVAYYLTAMNMGEIPEKKVDIEYMSASQVLVLPKGIVPTAGLDPNHPDMVALGAVAYADGVIDLAYKAEGLTLEQMENALDANPPAPVRLAADETVTVLNKRARMAANTVSRHVYTDEEDDYICGAYSALIGLNYDFRDFAAMYRTPDNQYINYTRGKTWEPRYAMRTASSLAPYTLLCIAALNYGQVANEAFAAWVRAYGVGIGLVPSANSVGAREYAFTIDQPSAPSMNAIRAFVNNFSATSDLAQCAAQVIIAFGLQHLHKDHTYQGTNLAESNAAYYKAMETVLPPDVMTDIRGKPEIYMRNAVHPFGLGATYAFATFCCATNRAAEALVVRRYVTPPPVQRLMQVMSAAKQWRALPVGLMLNEMYKEELEAMEKEYNQILDDPPAYSMLFKYYGIPSVTLMSAESVATIDSMIPIVVGFANAYYNPSGNKPVGLARAQAFKNVAREQAVMVEMFTTMWAEYRDTAQSDGLIKYITTSMAEA